MDAWFAGESPQRTNADLLKRYFEQTKSLPTVPFDFSKGYISRYDNIFKKYAPTVGWDWRLMAAQAFVESKFKPNARSWVGARGLMQIMPSTARGYRTSVSQLGNPETSVKVASKLINDLDSYLVKYVPNDKERLKFVIAAYNVGIAHVYDAIDIWQRNTILDPSAGRQCGKGHTYEDESEVLQRPCDTLRILPRNRNGGIRETHHRLLRTCPPRNQRLTLKNHIEHTHQLYIDMRKTILSVAIVCLLGSTMLTTPSCIGSFSLSNRLLGWNNTLGNKFLNELVFFAFWVLPVYEVCGLADLLVLNSIEFWSGSNPMAKGERTIEGNDGKYLVRCDGKGYDIVSCNDGSSVRLDSTPKNLHGALKPTARATFSSSSLTTPT